MIEDVEKQINTLIEKAVDYGTTTIELAKLKAVDKISDVAASVISNVVAFSAILLLVVFASLGLAMWLGELLGKIYFGFFAVAAIYALLGILIHLFLSKWIKKVICNYIIRRALN